MLGSGPGTYEQYWNQHRPLQHKVRDAHNLYLEVLAELGPVGLLLLLLALGAPLVAAVLARGHPLVPLALAAYVGLPRPRLGRLGLGDDGGHDRGAGLRGCAPGARRIGAMLRPALAERPRRGVVAGLALAVVAFVGVIGASALSASDDALTKGRYDEAASQARKAARWWRWSPDPWRQLGDVQSARGDDNAAQRATGRRSRRTEATGASGTTSTWSAAATSPAVRSRRPGGSTALPARISRRPTMLRVDPLANPEPLIRRVYSYVAYRVGDGPDAEDITSETFERALRYKKSYDSTQGRAGRLADRHRAALHRRTARTTLEVSSEHMDAADHGDLEDDTLRRIGCRPPSAASTSAIAT